MREGWAFLRRSRRYHPGLLAVYAAFCVAGGGAALAQLGADRPPPWAGELALLCMAGAFVCFVLLVRRDDPERTAKPGGPADRAYPHK
jgi:hypothetical protein